MVIENVVVALTDYGLAVVCAVFGGRLWRSRRRAPSLETRFAVFFGATALAALAGGTFHGFVADEPRLVGTVLWRVTLLAVGLAAAAAWQAGGGLVLAPRPDRWLSLAATLGFLAYAAVVLFLAQSFSMAIANYLPAALFLFGAFGVSYRRTGARSALLGALGVGLSLLGSGIQQARIGLPAVHFDHNALYHLIQAAAFALMFQGARGAVPSRPQAS
jgi:hypothetical protein